MIEFGTFKSYLKAVDATKKSPLHVAASDG